jgi:antitoxin MazE
MKSIHVAIRRIGNSQGVVIPKLVLAQVGLDAESGAQMSVEGGVLVLRKPEKAVRAGWAEAAQKIAATGNDALVMGEFANEIDSTLVW